MPASGLAMTEAASRKDTFGPALTGATATGGAPGPLPGGGLAGGRAHGCSGQDLVRLPQDLLDVLDKRVPELVARVVPHGHARSVRDTTAYASGPAAGSTAAARRTARDIARDAYLPLRLALHVHVVDLVDAQVGAVRHHRQIRAVELVSHVDLFRDAAEELGKRLIEGVQGDRAGDPGMNVDVHLCSAREREEQLANVYLVDDYGVGLGLQRRLRPRRRWECLHQRRNRRGGGRRLVAQVAFGGLHRLETAAKGQP